MGKSKYVITVTRQFGSLGRPIAKRMSELLGIEYYDRDLVDQAASKLCLPVSVVDEEEESARRQVAASPFSRMVFPLGKGTSDTQDKIFEAQQNIIQFLAEKETCIIVGRCSDFTLSEMKNSMHIYIYASYQARLEHCIRDLKMDEQEARRMIHEVDEARDSYHMHYAGYLPDDKNHKDILIDSSFLGIEGTASYLAEAVRRKFMLGGTGCEK
ncbi:MAG: AAA family ATPase [Fusicatenibacter sp.]